MDWPGRRIIAMEPEYRTTKTFYTTDGLVNNSIRSIIQSEDNIIWLSTSNGITRITANNLQEPLSYSFANFNQYDGVITDEFCERSVL